MRPCPCCSKIPFEQCCQPYIQGLAVAPTPETLMRSRYTAYATHAFEYVQNTMLGEPLKDFNLEEAKQSANAVKWEKLEIIDAPTPTAEEGFVEFKAYYNRDGKTFFIQEKSRFVKQENQWFYIDGEQRLTNLKPMVNENKVGRNDPCPCGSGKKSKKCCGANS